VGLAAVLVVLAAPACRKPIEPLVVEGARLVVTNTSKEAWRDVKIWVNTFYRADVATLEAGGRLDAPLNRFSGPYGRFFDPRREAVKGVEITATSSSGAPVTITWGEGRTWRGTIE
jgi:hypothetical protein